MASTRPCSAIAACGLPCEALAGRAAVPVEVGELPADRLPSDVEAAAYFVIAEALTNVARYAEAESAAVDVRRDNGPSSSSRSPTMGSVVPSPAGARACAGSPTGVAALDGRLEVESPAGAGTEVKAVIPCG